MKTKLASTIELTDTSATPDYGYIDFENINQETGSNVNLINDKP